MEEPVGYVIELDIDIRLYHAGDTRVFADMQLIR
jgi:L-ascorbate metabolism protein UlaG (beta-lactamase superfamily)